MKNTIADKVTELIMPVADELGFLLWDVEYVKEGADKILRITIDKEDGVDIDDCEAMHRRVDTLLDEADPIDESYHLEISSPGVERNIREDWQIDYCLGWQVQVRLFVQWKGAKNCIGTLTERKENGDIVVRTANGETVTFERKNVASLKSYYDFDNDNGSEGEEQ